MEIKNDGRLKICWMRIVGYQQFQDVFLDFTYPEGHEKAGEPLDKICLIGANGTGKSEVLWMIANNLIRYIGARKKNENQAIANHIIISKFTFGEKAYLMWFNDEIIDFGFWHQDKEKEIFESIDQKGLSSLPTFSMTIITGSEKGLSFTKQSDLLLFIPTESIKNTYLQIDDVPDTTLDRALGANPTSHTFEVISQERVVNFWNNLLWHLNARRQKRALFDAIPENKVKRLGDLDIEFDRENPQILTDLSNAWNRILAKAGLFFDYQNAEEPFGLDRNLHAYIFLASNRTHKIAYSKLSTGIRNYIFTIGHILSFYFNKIVHRGFLLVDEPENGLFPDFLYDLVDVYRQVTTDKNGENNTQMFFATHNPIIAAQFEPYERIILEWNDDGTVRARRGQSPIGDDPNDLLRKDFAVASLMGKEGREAWKRYLELKHLLKKEGSLTQKEEIADEYMELGRLYGFPA